MLLACLFLDWRNRNTETPSSLLLSRQLLRKQQALKAESEFYMYEKFRR